MATTFVVVAHQAGARFMVHKPGFGKNLSFVREIEHPEGRLKNSEIDTDRNGQSATGMRGAAGGRGMGHEETAHEHASKMFARELALEIAKARQAHEFDDLILVAEPRFLGKLDAALDRPTHLTLRHKVTKDLGSVSARDIASHMQDVLPL